MIKKVTTDTLKPGMHIHDLNCGWMDHPFLKNSFKIKNDNIIKKIIDLGIREVYIHTDMGFDDANAPTAEEVNNDVTSRIFKVAEISPKDIPRVPMKEEITRAKIIQKEAKQTIQNIMEDVRFGQQVETEKVENVVENMIYSIFRNDEALVSLVRIRKVDEYTYMHSMSVAVLMISFCKYLGFDEAVLKEVGVGAMLHDIGKMKIPQNLLLGNKQLTADEYKMMKEHVIFSRELLEKTDGVSRNAVLIAAEHHERVDGSGYPNGLKGDDISKFGRVAAIVDVYDAMTSDRCYQNKFEPTDVLRRLYEWSKHHFESTLVQKFIRCIGIYPIGSMVRLRSGMLAVVVKHGGQSLLQPVVRAIYNARNDRFYSVPRDIDLSLESGKNADRIVCYESPEKWNIQPEMYL
jgi:putative nucleotidyltransferase with HDIG domain